MLGGLTIYPWVANFLRCTSAKNCENWLAVDKVIAKIIRLTFLAHPVYYHCLLSDLVWQGSTALSSGTVKLQLT